MAFNQRRRSSTALPPKMRGRTKPDPAALRPEQWEEEGGGLWASGISLLPLTSFKKEQQCCQISVRTRLHRWRKPQLFLIQTLVLTAAQQQSFLLQLLNPEGARSERPPQETTTEHDHGVAAGSSATPPPTHPSPPVPRTEGISV